MLGFRRFLLDPDEGMGGGEITEETGVEEMETAEPSEESGEEETEVANPSDDKSDRAFAEMRRNLEEAQKRVAELEAQANDYEEALGLWFEGDNKIAQAHAHYEDISLDEAISNMNQKREINQLRAEKEALEEEKATLQFNNLKAQDLKAIKDAHPETTLKDVEELGEEFFKYRTMGIDAVTVYDAIQMKKGVPPKPMGKVKTGAPTNNGFFTRDEVANMSKKQIHDNYDKIRESMAKW